MGVRKECEAEPRRSREFDFEEKRKRCKGIRMKNKLTVCRKSEDETETHEANEKEYHESMDERYERIAWSKA